jgi:hypothetical protein
MVKIFVLFHMNDFALHSFLFNLNIANILMNVCIQKFFYDDTANYNKNDFNNNYNNDNSGYNTNIYFHNNNINSNNNFRKFDISKII